MIQSAIHRSLAIAVLLFLGSVASGFGVTLLPQEQAIAEDMINNPDQGRPYMVLDPVVQAVAEARAQDMANNNYFLPVNQAGYGANYLLTQAGYQLPSWWQVYPSANNVESIGAGSPDPSVIWTAWMNSPPHKEHILAQNAFYATETHYGVGYAYNPTSAYQYYWVIITAPPEPLAITTPTDGSTVKTPAIGVAGATDPGTSPASVQFRIENVSGTSAYQTATGVANWSGTATGLTPGRNVIRAQSLDGSGNVIDERTCAVTYVVYGTLTVNVSGSGAVTSSYAGVTSQPVGNPITIKEIPDKGYIFTGWTGSIISGSTPLTFPMQDGLSLQANFEPSPYLAASGAYYGLLTTGSGAQSGLVRLTVSSSGLFTGRINLSGASWSFTGTLDEAGEATVALRGGVTLTLQADLTGGSGGIAGTVVDGAGSFNFEVSQSTFNATTNAAPQAGRYTVALAPATTGAAMPQGDGYAAIVVGADGTATVTGRLADGTPYSATGHVANNGTLAIYCAPAGAALSGLLTFDSTDISDIDGTLTWSRSPQPRSAFYPAGFSMQLTASGSHYVRPGAGLQTQTVSPGPAAVDFSGGGISAAIAAPVIVSEAGKVKMATPGLPDVKLSINPISGAVSGTFVPPGGETAAAIRGVVVQKRQAAYGYFRAGDACGGFSLDQ